MAKIAGESPITEADGLFTGEDQSLRFTIYDNAQAAKDITGWTIQFKMAATQSGAAVVTKSATLTTPASGICTVALSATDLTLSSGVYFYALSRTDAGQNQVLAWGSVVLQGRPA